jgi:hypothetical protein
MEKQIMLYLTELRNISKIPINGRVDSTKSSISHYTGGVVAWIMRKYYRDDRSKSVQSFVTLYTDVCNITNHLMNTDILDISLLVSLKNHIDGSVVGLQNFSKTYKDDVDVQSKIQILQEAIVQPQLKKINKWLRKNKTSPRDNLDEDNKDNLNKDNLDHKNNHGQDGQKNSKNKNKGQKIDASYCK